MALMMTLSKEPEKRTRTWRKRINSENWFCDINLFITSQNFCNSQPKFTSSRVFFQIFYFLFLNMHQTICSLAIREQKLYQTLRYREDLYPLAKFVPHLCLLVNLTGNLSKDCATFCKSESFLCQHWKMKLPKSIFNYQSYHQRNILYTMVKNKGFSFTFSISYKITFSGEHHFQFFNFRNQYKQATTISWSPGLKPKWALFTQDPKASADSCTHLRVLFF